MAQSFHCHSRGKFQWETTDVSFATSGFYSSTVSGCCECLGHLAIIQKAEPVVPHPAEGLRRPNSSLVGNGGGASPSPLFLRKVVRDVRSLEKPTWDGRMGGNAPSSNRKWKRHTSYLGIASSLPYEDPNTIPSWGWGSEKIRIKKETQPVPWEHEGHHCTQEAINKY